MRVRCWLKGQGTPKTTGQLTDKPPVTVTAKRSLAVRCWKLPSMNRTGSQILECSFTKIQWCLTRTLFHEIGRQYWTWGSFWHLQYMHLFHWLLGTLQNSAWMHILLFVEVLHHKPLLHPVIYEANKCIIRIYVRVCILIYTYIVCVCVFF